MIELRAPSEREMGSVLGRTSPLVKIAIAVVWLAGLVATLDPRPPLVLTAFASLAALLLGRVPLASLARGLVPLGVAAVVIGVFNAVFSGRNTDPSLTAILSLGPLRVVEPAIREGAALALRVVAIAATSVCFARTTDATRLADALVQQARLSDRFAYGALAAYQAVPALADDLLAIRQARRIRGLATSWHPGVLISLLALAIRRGDRQAIAMDARGFGRPSRTYFRLVRWSLLDGAVAAGGIVALALALLVTRV